MQPLQGLSHFRFRLFRVRSPLLTESLLFSLPRGTEMFQFSRLPLQTYGFSLQSWPITTRGFPHSDICGSMLAYSSPQHFGVRPVLLRLLAPRHPPCALPTFTVYVSSCPSLDFHIATFRYLALLHSLREISHPESLQLPLFLEQEMFFFYAIGLSRYRPFQSRETQKEKLPLLAPSKLNTL
jgi:hypothetical protein